MTRDRCCMWILLLLIVVSPASAQTTDADANAINGVREDLRRLTRDADVAGAMRLFTEDAMYLRPGQPADSGRDAIRRHWQEGVDAMVVDIDWRADEIEVSGDLAFLRGSLTFRGTPRGGGNQVVNEQRYIWILRRHAQEGWQIARYMRHSPPRS